MSREATVVRTWYDDDSFWNCFGRAAFTEERFARAHFEVDRILRFLPDVRPPALVVDFGCGPGRHSLDLARRGYHVTAVDRTHRFLATLRTRATAERLPVATIRADLLQCELAPRQFALALCIGLTFGYYEDADNARLLRNFVRVLSPGAALILDAPTPTWAARDGDWFIVSRSDLNALVERVPTRAYRVRERWTVRGRAGDREFLFDQRVYTPDELEALLRDAGFRKVQTFSDVLGRPLRSDARKTVAVAIAP
jgi:SAM-dependent methyltransferase